MESHKVRFLVNLAFVISTSYILIWYIFRPSSNQCQMTFMMEPPKFLNVPFDNNKKMQRKLEPSNDLYRLYMYSEFGFPSALDTRRDLKDSMPVLFVPGNAGSYQQVRSLASTCIRLQLQSLDAFKFIFYTIDFKGELSGISGDLIEDQITFVDKSLKQILSLHPPEIGGVILIGHSVGGFISKAMFALPDFDTSSVSLLISLASPLKKPYLNFDSKMNQLYLKTNDYWTNRKPEDKILAISISGGRSDHLVPMHLSQDDQYDLSMTTSSIKDVWMPADHVCITWCRELMHKLGNLLSAVMDKRHTHLMKDKKEALAIIKRELYFTGENNSLDNKIVIQKDWRITRQLKQASFESSYIATRGELSENLVVLNLDKIVNHDLLIFIDYVGNLNYNEIYGCRELDTKIDGVTSCIDRVNLMHLATPIPSRRFETKKTKIILKRAEGYIINFLVLDFLKSHDRPSKDLTGHTSPELVIVQTVTNSEVESLYIPSLFRYYFDKILFLNSYQYDVTNRDYPPIAHHRFKLSNLNQKTQIYSIMYESRECLSGGYPSEATILFFQGAKLVESFHQTPTPGGTQLVLAQIGYQVSVMDKNVPKDEFRLEFYTDGTCKNTFKLKVDLLDLFTSIIQLHLDKILACVTYLAYSFTVLSASRWPILRQRASDSLWKRILGQFLVTAFLFWMATKSDDLGQVNLDMLLDCLTSVLLIYLLSYGIISLLDYFIRRLLDLATIMFNVQSFVRNRINQPKIRPNGADSERTKPNEEVDSKNGLATTSALVQNIMGKDFDWPMIGLVIAGSFVFSPALISIAEQFLLLRLQLHLQGLQSKVVDNVMQVPSSLDQLKLASLDSLVMSIATFSGLSGLSNIPAALLMMNDRQLKSADLLRTCFKMNVNSIVSCGTILLVKLVTENLVEESCHLLRGDKRQFRTRKQRAFSMDHILYRLPTSAHLLSLVPIILVHTDIRHMSSSFLVTLIWLQVSLSKSSASCITCRR